MHARCFAWVSFGAQVISFTFLPAASLVQYLSEQQRTVFDFTVVIILLERCKTQQIHEQKNCVRSAAQFLYIMWPKVTCVNVGHNIVQNVVLPRFRRLENNR